MREFRVKRPTAVKEDEVLLFQFDRTPKLVRLDERTPKQLKSA
jgi:hypothetical protein